MDFEEKYATDLLRPLVRQPRTPSTVDVARAVAEGERRQRTMRLAGATAAGLAVVLVLAGGWAISGGRRAAPAVGDLTAPPPTASATAPASTGPAGPASCRLERLAVPAGQPPKSVVSGADPTGRFILGRSYPGGQSPRVLIWDNGVVHAIAMSGEDQLLHDITSTGVAVGTSFIGGSASQTAAWVYKNGKVTRLAGGVAEANAINDRETIAGSVNGKPAMWSSPGAAPTMLALPPGARWTGWASGIDEDGTIVGRLNSGPGAPDEGYMWHPDGSVEKLPVPSLYGAPAKTFTADAIRDGWVVGWGLADTGDILAPRWNLHTGQVDLTFDGFAHNVNRQGWMVGEHGPGGALVADGRTVTLPDLGGTDRLIRTTPDTISDDGATVAGQVELPNVGPVAVRWLCR